MTPHGDIKIQTDIQRRLLTLRWVLITLEATGLLLLDQWLGANLPRITLLGLVGLHIALAIATTLNLRRNRDASSLEIFLDLCADAALMATLIYFCGGYANPFISLLLLPLLLTITLLQSRWAWGMAALIIVFYSLLAHYYRPLAIPVSSKGAMDLHLTGMWLNFILTVALLTLFMVRLSRALHRQEAILSAERERALRDEHIFLLGMQAATAAHDLATPMATVRLGLEALHEDYAGDEELTPALQQLIGQTERMQTILGRIAAAAGVSRAGEKLEPQPVTDWIRETLDHWQIVRPQIPVELQIATLPEMPVTPDPAWVSVFTAVLNNAADTGGTPIEISVTTITGKLCFAIRDHGPGFAVPTKTSGGWGIGLVLVRASLERLGGDLQITEAPCGGAVVTIQWPVREW